MRHALEFNADFPSGQLQLGLYALSRNRLAEAEAHYARAVSWDPRSAPLRHELAVVLSLTGRMAEAVEHLQEARRLAPDEGEYAYKLGLALNEAGRPAESLEALELAVRLSPRHARAWYNLGLARHAAGHSEAAVEALVRAESEEARDPEIPYARATILMHLNRPEEARAGALRALEIQPGYDPALALLRSLGGR
jgi:tetratricopeptide (TPR) repeat protein